MRPTLLPLALVLAALLAGCFGGGKGQDGDGPEGVLPAEIDSGSKTLGAISGVVVDEAIRPLAGANITINGGPSTTTDAGGLFAFTGLQPGFYAMAASAPLYLGAQVTADVVAGETTKVRVQLLADPAPQPYHVTYVHEGFMQAWGGIAQFFVEEVAESGTCDCRLYVQPEPNATTAVYEAVWEQTNPDPAGLAEFYWILEEVDGELYESGYCFSPCTNHVGLGDYTGLQLMARLDGPDLWVQVQQPVRLFLTLFYNGPAPDGWSIVEQS